MYKKLIFIAISAIFTSVMATGCELASAVAARNQRKLKKRNPFGAGLATILMCLVVLMFTSCVTQYHAKLKADIIGFNDNVTTSYTGGNSKPYDLLLDSDSKAMKRQVLGLKQGSNTAAYYALDLGLDRVKQVLKKFMQKDPNSKYYVVMLTDGLDNVSTSLKKGKYANGDAYAAALQRKMETIMGKKPNVFKSYVLLYEGDDLKESGYTEEELRNKLSVFTGAQNDVRPDVLHDSNLDKLYEKFEAEFTITSFDFEVPKDYAGKRIRMLLNDEQDTRGQIYFEADLVKKGKSYRLERISTSRDLSIEIPVSGFIKMDDKHDKNSTKAGFSIKKMRYDNGSYKINKKNVTQWFEDGGKFRKNSEYSATASNMKNAYILVILDTSTSFASQITAAKETILKIVEFISKEI
ncbi:MAG: hypothetical protein LBQ01_07895 [Prevotellaceae bacterium]|jgi:Mg-chelatase subunit ChlD|nr:hypothetical protein [Prevotellaceae bacterium]